MTLADLDIGLERTAPRGTPRRAALDALERLLRAQVALTEHRTPESPYGLLRPAREDEVALIEAVFAHSGVPLPDTLRAVYRRTLGVGNPVSSVPVLAAPFLRAALPDEGFGPRDVGLVAFEEALGVVRREAVVEQPPVLVLGHAAPVGLTAGRNGLWSLGDFGRGKAEPQPSDFGLTFEAAFRAFVDQVLLLWANDLAGDPLRRDALDVTRGVRLGALPDAVRQAWDHLVAPRALTPRSWEAVQPLDGADLLQTTRRGAMPLAAGPLTSHVTVVGLPYADRPEIAHRIVPGALLRLRPVEDNPHDPMAVEVWHDGAVRTRVGFVARAEAPRVRALPRGAVAWRLRVVGRTDTALCGMVERLPADGASDAGLPEAASPDLFSRSAA